MIGMVGTRGSKLMVARLRAPGLYRAFFGLALGIVFAAGLTWLVRMATGHTTYHHFLNEEADDGGLAAVRADLLPLRPRRIRLLALLGLRTPDPPRGSLRARGLELEGLLPHQHRSQGDRHPVHGHSVLLPARRRVDGDADARAAGPARRAVRQREHLQRALLGARLAADLPVRDPRVRGLCQLRAADHDRRARHGLPAPERALLLALAAGRSDDAVELRRSRRRLRRRLDRLRAAVDRRADRAGLLLGRGAVRGRLLDHDGAELPGDDHHDARARG